MAAGSVRVVVADDHEVVRCGLANLLDGTDVEIVAEASSGEAAVRLAMKHKPDVILLDIRMAPGNDGLKALEKIRNDAPGVRCIMLTTFDNPTYIARAVASGAHDYILKFRGTSLRSQVFICISFPQLLFFELIMHTEPETSSTMTNN